INPLITAVVATQAIAGIGTTTYCYNIICHNTFIIRITIIIVQVHTITTLATAYFITYYLLGAITIINPYTIKKVIRGICSNGIIIEFQIVCIVEIGCISILVLHSITYKYTPISQGTAISARIINSIRTIQEGITYKNII